MKLPISAHCYPEPLPSQSAACRLVFLVVLAAVASGGWADERRIERRPDSPVGDLSKRLGVGDYVDRQQAMLELWRRRDETRRAVQRAARDSDPEVAARARWILRQWRRGAVPGTPGGAAMSALSQNPPKAIEALLEAGRFASAVVAVEESLGTIEQDAIQTRVSRVLNHRFPILAVAAHRQHAADDLLRLIDLTADSKELAVCRIELMRWLGIEFDSSDPAELLPRSASRWDQSERDVAVVLVFAALGRHREAVEYAESANDPDGELVRVARMLGGRWQELAAVSATRGRETELETPERVRAWSHALIAAERSGDLSIRDEAVERLRGLETGGDSMATSLRWKSLAIHGEVEAACEILAADDPDNAGAVALAASRTGLAFQRLGYPLAEIESNLQGWLNAALRAQRESPDETPVIEVRKLLTLTRCLLSIGRDDLAWRISKRLAESPVAVGRIRLRAYVLYSLASRSSRDDWVRQLALSPGEKTLSIAAENSLVRTLPDADRPLLKLLLDAVEEMKPELSFRRRVEVVHRWLAGELPPEIDPKTDFKRLFHHATSGRERQLERVGGRVVLQPQVKISLPLAKFYARHGQADYSRRCLERLDDRGDIQARFELAEDALAEGRLEASAELFRGVWEAVAEKDFREGGRSHVEFAGKTLAGRLAVAERLGDAEWAAELGQQLRLALCTPSSETRRELGEYLLDRGRTEMADACFRTLLPLTAFGTPEGTEFADVARLYSMAIEETSPGQAARWLDLAIAGTLESAFFVPAAYVTLPLYSRRWALRDAIARGDRPAVRSTLATILKLDPLDINFAELLLPKMREAGMEQLADETLERVIRRGRDYCRRFPFDATTANNVAWVAAVNKSHLDDALALAEQAVYVEPESAIYRDTLAEVLYQRGRHGEALQVERACLLDDPDQWHLHEQVRKFKRHARDN